MSQVLVFVESSGGKVKKASLELVWAAKSAGATVSAFAIGEKSKSLAGELGSFGAEKLFALEGLDVANYNPEIYTAVAAELIKRLNPKSVLASASATARDFFPRVAARLQTGLVGDATEISFANGSATVRKPLYSGKCSAEITFKGSGPQIVLMRPNQIQVGAPSGGAAATVEELVAPKLDLKTMVREVVKGASSKLDLSEANIIVSGGRGMKGPEHFGLLNSLAEVLGATVGASRAVVDAGWVSHDMQVGQTGKTVAPTLYIACGISGAIQHLAGMSSSKVIVAINKDPEAPIFKKATYGIVGDVFEVLPKLTDEFKKLLQH